MSKFIMALILVAVFFGGRHSDEMWNDAKIEAAKFNRHVAIAVERVVR